MPFGDKDNPVTRESLESLTYRDSNNEEHPYPVFHQGPHTIVLKADGTIVDDEAYKKDQLGFTHPNLHRRVDPQQPPTPEDPNYDPDDPESVNRAYLNQEVAPRDYAFAIEGVHSYRTTTYNTHDEESTTSEIP